MLTTPAPVSGTTRLYVVLGDPVVQVRSPLLVNPLLARLGVDAVLVPVHARPEHLARILDGLRCVGNVDGIFVTVPHKAAVVALADRCSPMVRIAGSANALRRDDDGSWYAENFDGLGFVAGLVAAGHEPAGRRVALVGAGARAAPSRRRCCRRGSTGWPCVTRTPPDWPVCAPAWTRTGPAAPSPRPGRTSTASTWW